ncbi:radical SAM/SPASM domain-containing protein [Youngiibacter multivorans]|uniref:radical SAM/SPASM domain-containing protein n=1 Tax=Youngiibacter multivorans TaxID=937251 RepID=UPI001AE4B831|nr:radical SAM/SPASM domain-containing protein [Youngiibacter multivorans]
MKRFKRVYIETTNICNLDCSFCIKTKREKLMMDARSFRHIAEEVSEFTDHVCFHLMGEPLMNESIGEFLSICSELGLKVNLATNGILIGSRSKVLLASPALRKVSFSLHSYEANEMGISLEEYLKDIMDFAAAASGKVINELRLWNLSGELAEGLNSENEKVVSYILESLGLEREILTSGKGKNGIKLMEGIYLGFQERFVWPEEGAGTSAEYGFCHGMRDHIGILADGTVVPCCLDSQGSIPLGNVFDTQLKEILSGDRAVAIYEGFNGRRLVEDLCKGCTYIRRFDRKGRNDL